ncbi:hypothetical protein [Streptomyces sp. NPDC002962]|uniref:hypothetical protein n=1 Tax=Streptomyces sp. NPDC002962 TaxID=3364674 RepID=UPI0036B311D8
MPENSDKVDVAAIIDQLVQSKVLNLEASVKDLVSNSILMASGEETQKFLTNANYTIVVRPV